MVSASREQGFEEQAAGSMPGGSLRVVHVTGQAGPTYANGVSRAVHYLSAAQRALGHEVLVATIENDRLRARRTGQKWVLRAARIAPGAGRVLDLIECISEYRSDVVHLHSIHLLSNVSLAAYLRRTGVPYCVTVHGGLFGRRRGRVKKAAFWRLCERGYLNAALFVHALTTAEAADLRTCGVTSPIVVAPNGIHMEAVPRPTEPEALLGLAPELRGKRVFMFIGRLDPLQKGLDLLLHGFAMAAMPAARLVMVGPAWKGSEATLHQLVDRLGLQSTVTFLPPAGPERCADLLAGADVFVHASRWEGVSLAVLEAAASGKACLLTHHADPMGALGAGGGATTVAATPESIAEGIRLLTRMDDAHLHDMGERARTIVTSTFRWSDAARTLLDGYRRPDVSSS